MLAAIAGLIGLVLDIIGEVFKKLLLIGVGAFLILLASFMFAVIVLINILQ